jgi:uncharacterized protein YdiU (UPF0061 family)
MHQKRFQIQLNAFRILLLFIALTAALPVFAAPDRWERMSSGHHTFKYLGSRFYVNAPVKKIEGARLVLFNFEAAKALGLELPDDPKLLEQLVLEQFAYMIDANGTADKQWFATYYQDSSSKAAGEARGDGRALWTGELPLTDGQGNIDVMVKGIGVTPLAWSNHSDPSHKDGLQSMREAVHSFVMSELNRLNELNSTIDLAVIEIPTTKTDHRGRQEKASLTIRVGEQTRMAHLKFWSDSKKGFSAVFDFVIRRALHMKFDAPVSQAQRDQYLRTVAINLADEAARYYDLHAVHGSPTAGNRTSSGATIDLGTFRYLDAHHSEYSYLFDKLKLGGNHGQTEQLSQYLTEITNQAARVGITLDLHEALATFDEEYRRHLTDLWLMRLGLNEREIAKVSRETRTEFFDLLEELSEIVSTETVKTGSKNLHPALYKPRVVLAGLWKAVFSDDQEASHAVYELLTGSKSNFVNSLPVIGGKSQAFSSKLARIVKKISRDIGSLRPDSKKIIANAASIPQRGPLGTELGQSLEKPILEGISEGDVSFSVLSRMAGSLAERQRDPRLLTNQIRPWASAAAHARQCIDVFAVAN